MWMDQTYCQNQDNSQKKITIKKGTKNIKSQPTEKLSLNAIGVQSVK